MTYTHSQTQGAFHQLRITPLDASIVRFALTVKVTGYPITVGNEQLSLYTSLALTRTKTKDKEAIETYLKRYGISLKVETSYGMLTYQGSVRKEFVPETVKLLKEMLTADEIDVREFALKKKLALEDNREAHDDAKRIAHIAFTNLLYDRENFMRGTTLMEEREAITAVKIGDVSAVVKSLPYGEWFFSITGSPESETQFEPLVKLLRKTVSPESRIVIETRSRDAQSVFVTVPGKTNVEVRIGNVIPITSDHDAFLPLEFGLTVLGKVGGFSGRLMSTVREKEGLTYGIYARILSLHRENTIHWNIFTFFTAQDLEKGLKATKRELRLIVEKGITEEELVIFKEIIQNQHILNHESNATRLSYYHGLSVFGYTEADIEKLYKRIMSLTVKEVNAALRTYIDLEKLIIAGAGPVRPDGTGITTAVT